MTLNRPLDWWAFLISPWRNQCARDEYDVAVQRRLNTLEVRMSLTDDALADLDDATNEVADELDALEQEVARLAEQAGAADSSVAEKIRAASTRLRGLASDPENPVPDTEPGPADGNTPGGGDGDQPL